MTIAILGGGLSGLTLARLLHERGDDVVVLEAEKDYGGLCRSYIENDFTFDIGGSHIIFSRDTEVLSFMRSMIEGNEKRDTRNTKIFYKSNYVKYPFENGISDLPFKDRFFCFNEFLKTLISIKIGKQSVPKNFKEWIYYTFGKGIAECYMIPYNEKIWKYPTNRMSMHWVEGRIPRPPVKDVIKAAIGIPTEGYTHQAVFSYPLIGGIKSLIHAISSPIKDRIKTGFRIQSIKKKSNCWQISDGVNTIESDRCINTIPLQHLLPCLENVPSDVISACNALVYNSLVCVTIGIQGPVPPFSWLYIPSPSLGKTNRISFPSNYSPEVTPPGYGSILAEITHHPYDEVARMTDEELTNEVIATLNAMKIGIKDRIVYTRVWRQPFAYVVYDLEYQKNIKVIRDYCTHIKIPLVGRFAQFEYLNMDGCIRSVMDFVRTYPPEPHAF